MTPQFDPGDKKRIWMRPQYSTACLRSGGIPILTEQLNDADYIENILSTCDGILFTGGVDINPKYYGEDVLPECGSIADERDEFELPLYKAAAERDMPIFGICRGIQLINVGAGGSLIQHIPAHNGSEHDVEIKRDSLFYDILKRDRIHTNSWHHQAVKVPAPNMIASGWSDVPETGRIIEAIYDPHARFNAAVQWHPENMYYNDNDECSKLLFDAFISACTEYMLGK